MDPKLVAYQYVTSGFEMVINSPDVETGKVWNLWFNIKLSDDPETWDSEVKSINKMQDRLGELTVGQRLIRAQIAEFCRLHPLSPGSIDILCEEIGSGHFSRPVKIGCEGRDLLDSLGYHTPQSLNAQRKESLKKYAIAFKNWLAKGHPENSVESKPSVFLGQSTDNKVAFVEEVVYVLDSEEPSISSIKKLCENEYRKPYGKAIPDTNPRPFNCFNCEQSSLEPPNCLCCYSMLLDAGLLCAGRFGEEVAMLEEFRRPIEENILAYSVAINSWLEGTSPQDVSWPRDTRYVTRNNSLEIAKRVHSSLGNKDEAKEWLAACLLKTVKDNQRWHKRTELIDGFPEAISWLGETLLAL